MLGYVLWYGPHTRTASAKEAKVNFVLLLPLKNIPQGLGIKNTVLWEGTLKSVCYVRGKGKERVT